VEESGFSVDPWPTMRRAEFGFGVKGMPGKWRELNGLQADESTCRHVSAVVCSGNDHNDENMVGISRKRGSRGG